MFKVNLELQCKISSLLLNQNEQDPFLLLNSRVHSYVWLLEVKKDYVNIMTK